ncbi:hypothetical protein [Synechococcus sp. PCC 6312]|uniref:hypothetical protein n=1 Tax=Synechococcus sp. (strain ATCC 27167 / PCC 6312) TaxID=195253 RepID=UPI00030F9629|nr:hypothetical protein [Synechococcus sp. PCC 6312]
MMQNYWVPGVNNLGKFGRWAFAEFKEVYEIEADFKQLIEENFGRLIQQLGESS